MLVNSVCVTLGPALSLQKGYGCLAVEEEQGGGVARGWGRQHGNNTVAVLPPIAGSGDVSPGRCWLNGFLFQFTIFHRVLLTEL